MQVLKYSICLTFVPRNTGLNLCLSIHKISRHITSNHLTIQIATGEDIICIICVPMIHAMFGLYMIYQGLSIIVSFNITFDLPLFLFT